MLGTEDSLKKLGLSENRIKELTSQDSLKKSCDTLVDIVSKCEKTLSDEQGSLLDELVTKMSDSVHVNLVVNFIISEEVNRPKLRAVLKYLSDLKGDLEEDDFKKQCGIGINVEMAAVEEKISAICDANKDNLENKKWNFQGQLFGSVQKDAVLQWADGKLVSEVINAELEKRLGPRPQKVVKAKASQQKKEVKVNEEELDPNQYKELRMQQIQKLRDAGINPFPHKFNLSLSLEAYREKYESLEKGQQLEEKHKIVGRIVHRRDSSAKLIFLVIEQQNHQVQVLANFKFYATQDKWSIIMDALRRGDTIGIEGFPASSNTGELSIVPTEVTLLSPCYHMIPHKLKEVETRYRNRHLDMLVNANVVKTFATRSKIIQFIRHYFDERGFLEVETPTMNVLAGGATAKPFITYHNDLGVNLFMRVAPELFLKQLIIGGMHKIYEIGKNYRNEGIDLTHNPEFTSIEAYEAFADYEDWIKETENLISSLVFKLHGAYEIDYHPHGRDDPTVWKIDFTPPFKRVPMIATLEEKLGVKFPEDLLAPETNLFLIALCKKHEVECTPPHTTSRLLDALVGDFIEADLINPGFITDHPQIMSPLAKWHRSSPGLTERFELFVAKKEICNSYTELNDPDVQRKMFTTQSVDREAGDDEAQPIDDGYCTSMEYGLPPTGGWGLGIDRLTMMLTDNNNIKEVILFPAMRPLEEQVQAQRQQLKGVEVGELASLKGK